LKLAGLLARSVLNAFPSRLRRGSGVGIQNCNPAVGPVGNNLIAIDYLRLTIYKEHTATGIAPDFHRFPFSFRPGSAGTETNYAAKIGGVIILPI
jgi:hypothetical protein